MNDQVKMRCHEDCKFNERFSTISICKKFNFKHLAVDHKSQRSIPCDECKKDNAVVTILVNQL